ncbi:hypothetical protein GFS60_06813 (plasmid) [Rhodococcus sp. WAY2]|nr:hypothetical protein GFS60_06813 [Rhodococcus sp. WAY2]
MPAVRSTGRSIGGALMPPPGARPATAGRAGRRVLDPYFYSPPDHRTLRNLCDERDPTS